MKKKWSFFAYKQSDRRNALLPITKTPKNYTATITLLQYSGIVIPILGFDPKLFIPIAWRAPCYNLAGRFHGWSIWLSRCCGL